EFHHRTEIGIYCPNSNYLAHTTIGCGEQGFPSAQPYLSHIKNAVNSLRALGLKTALQFVLGRPFQSAISFSSLPSKRMLPEAIQQKLDKVNACALSRGFICDYQQEREQTENTIRHKALAPATDQNYEKTRRLPTFLKKDPDPSPQLLKSFTEYYIITRENFPSQKSAYLNFSNFVAR
ncbi:hypothetical protein N7468_002911, partial [Penicillium chermesinum]